MRLRSFVAGLVLCVGAATGSWLLARSSVPPSDTAERAGSAEPAVVSPVSYGPRAAQTTVDRLELFRAGHGSVRLELDGAELTGLLRHAVPGLVPVGVSDPIVSIDDGTLRIRVRLAPDAWPRDAAVDPLLRALPDTVDVELLGRLERWQGRRLAFHVDRATAERLPLPSGVVSAAVTAISRRADARLDGSLGSVSPSSALHVAWPRWIRALDVVDDRVILVRAEPPLQRSVDGSDGG